MLRAMPIEHLTGDRRKLVKEALLAALRRTTHGAIELDPVKLGIDKDAIASVLEELCRDYPALCVTKWPGGGLALARRTQTEASLSEEGKRAMLQAGLIFNAGDPINPDKPELSPDPNIGPEQQAEFAKRYETELKGKIANARKNNT